MALIHDAEVHALRLDRSDWHRRGVVLELRIYVFGGSYTPRGDGQGSFDRHALVTLAFDGVEAVELSGFGRQNVLWDLEVEESRDADGSRLLVSMPAELRA